MRFFLGTHIPQWLYLRDAQADQPFFADIPLFVSARRLRDRKVWRHKASVSWALDSGGFSELSMHGRWTITPEQYIREAWEWCRQLGKPEFMAPQDWMCEPVMLEKTGKTVREHQELTIANYLVLKDKGYWLPFIPVLQGWEHDDYLRHVEDYKKAGVDLRKLPLVGVGSVCRRQDTRMAEELMKELCSMGIKTHGFGFKLKGLERSAKWMASADSMAWSFAARRSPPLPGCTHKSCANCKLFARQWQAKAMICVGKGMAAKSEPSLF